MSCSHNYDDLNESLQCIINDVKVILGDNNADYPWLGVDEVDNNDSYTVLLRHVLGLINITAPTTNFNTDNVPTTLHELMRLGLTVAVIESRMNRWVEVPNLSGYSGPFADESQFLSRWQSRLSAIQPVWNKAKNTQKLRFLPQGAGTVNRQWSSQFGGRLTIPNILQGMPSWFYGR